MSTQDMVPNIISSILLALWRMYPSRPEKVLRYLLDPPSPNDYRYLDAFAALCSLVPQCESASAAVSKFGGEFVHLYIATNPPAPHTLRNVMVRWIQLIQRIAATTPSSREAQTPVENFIADVYRVCHTKLFDAVRYECQGEDLLEEFSSAAESYVELLGIDAPGLGRSSLVDSLKVLTSMVGRDLEASSIEEILRLHAAARTAGRYKDRLPDAEFLPIANRLSEAVDFIVAFATSEDNQEAIKHLKNVDWIDAASSRDIIATTDAKGFIEPTPDEQELYVKVFDKLDGHYPECMSEVEGSPGHVKATSIMHCESALLHYILDNNLLVQVDPYIGTSRPACYACMMLVRAFNSAFRKNFALGRRCNTFDATWMVPDVGPKVYDKLVSSLRSDFELLAEKVYYDRARMAGVGPA